MKTPEPLTVVGNNQGVSLQKAIPKNLPSHLNQFEDTQFLIVQAKHAAEFGVGLLIPIPFVTDMAYDAAREEAAKAYHQAYAKLSPYLVTLERMRQDEALYNPESDLKLYPLVIMTEGDDEVFRITLFYQLEEDEWLGRYFFHLPSTIPTADIAKPTAQQLDRFRDELALGVDTLLPILKQDLTNQLPNTGQVAVVGSRYIVGGKLGGLMSPDMAKMKNVQVLNQTPDTVLLRAPGNMMAHADDGAFWYGIHYFFKDQLSYFELQND